MCYSYLHTRSSGLVRTIGTRLPERSNRQQRRVRTVALASDLHFPFHQPKLWRSFKRWQRAEKPDLTVLNGDIFDLAGLGRFMPEESQPPYLVREMRMGIREIHQLHGKVVMLDGNHEARWRKALIRELAPQMRGMIGLSFAEQMYAQGLDKKKCSWVFETAQVYGLWLGSGEARTLIRHGDHQFPMGPKAIAQAMLARTPHVNQVIGHVHRVQLYTQTSVGKVRWAMSLGTMQKPQEFAKDPNWQHGFGVLHFWGGPTLDTCTHVQPVPVLMDEEGSFVYQGRLWYG